jgi:hypothetical protein
MGATVVASGEAEELGEGLAQAGVMTMPGPGAGDISSSGSMGICFWQQAGPMPRLSDNRRHGSGVEDGQ